MNLEDLWIGDMLRVRSTNIVGTYAGLKNGKAGIRIEGKVRYFQVNDLEIYDQANPSEEEKLEEQKENRVATDTTFEPKIDLHLEKLPPYPVNSHLSVLDFQLKQCRLYLDKAVERKVSSVIIIHGKGEGILRKNIGHLLGEYDEVFQIFEKNQGGALEVMFHYRHMI